MSMMILTVEELESQGIPYRTSSQFLFQNRLFAKNQSFSQRARQAAIELGQQYATSGIFCLLVESKELITLCTLHSQSRSTVAAQPVPIAPTQSRRTYRGNVY